jgi:acid phosphatase
VDLREASEYKSKLYLPEFPTLALGQALRYRLNVQCKAAMNFLSSFVVMAFASLAATSPVSLTATDAQDVYAAQATAKTESPTSHVPGKAFDRYVSIWLENTDFDVALADRRSNLPFRPIPFADESTANLAYFAQKGITLTNNYALSHPSEPNYMAVVGGD